MTDNARPKGKGPSREGLPLVSGQSYDSKTKQTFIPTGFAKPDIDIRDILKPRDDED